MEQVKGELEKSDLIFSIKAGKISVKQINALRSSLPETSKAQVVKNTLMTRYVDSTQKLARVSCKRSPTSHQSIFLIECIYLFLWSKGHEFDAWQEQTLSSFRCQPLGFPVFFSLFTCLFSLKFVVSTSF